MSATILGTEATALWSGRIGSNRDMLPWRRGRVDAKEDEMIKASEIGDQDSCFNRAGDNEWLFVLLGRDKAAPATIRFWINERIRLGKNAFEDTQIQEAVRCANAMEVTQKYNSRST